MLLTRSTEAQIKNSDITFVKIQPLVPTAHYPSRRHERLDDEDAIQNIKIGQISEPKFNNSDSNGTKEIFDGNNQVRIFSNF